MTPDRTTSLLPGSQFKYLHDALVEGFSSYELLELFTRRHLELRLADVCAPTGVPQAVYALIGWAEQHGRVADLIVAALTERPSHAGLSHCARALCERRSVAPAAFVLANADLALAVELTSGSFYLVGRDPRSNIPIPRSDRKASVRHAWIDVVEGGIVVRDLASKNRLFVNERPVHTHFCRPGDTIRVGRTTLQLRAANDPSATKGGSPQDLPVTDTETDMGDS